MPTTRTERDTEGKESRKRKGSQVGSFICNLGGHDLIYVITATTLDQAHALDRKWSVHTPSAHHPTSPNAVGASPAMSTILQSPALGEVKGWFSNLFNWKSLSYVLCSMSDMWTTKNEARRLLESMGVEVTEGEEAGVAPLKGLVTEGGGGH